jgi:hypothetical protein
MHRLGGIHPQWTHQIVWVFAEIKNSYNGEEEYERFKRIEISFFNCS